MPEQIGQVEWSGDEFLRDVERATRAGVDAAGAVVVRSIQAKLNRQGGPSTRPGSRAAFSRGFNRLRSRALGLPVTDSKQGRRDDRLISRVLSLGGLTDRPGGTPRLRTGNLLRSIIDQRSDNGSEIGVAVGAGAEAPYADIQEFGTRQPIVPKNKKFLSWLNAVGERVFAKSVSIPARPFIRPGFESAKPAAFEAFVNEARRRLGESGGGDGGSL